ncbi:MAG TPA: ribonuclease H-like domain-containing protein [Patescibacteria group bacterium]|uniref:DEAD/DEAH box helicase domain protein n=1 Tax=Candidatus Uhrbacteria bacterium GW2011_GWA2_52_8d TaxID=1618979 RepID=A0A0G1XKC4_9BACT|nr:MAG: DEAD/DEAH box helicase domain protein [Candidatus Uhrbacteria bacterium GW2011_GWA2_52_8d]HLD20627.1 ribonuclease H-like domain-containing protein [Patescibacteria group bacterium]
MSTEVVFDIETQSAAGADFKEMRISVVGVYFYETDEYQCFEEKEFPQLWKRLEKSDRLIGYNSRYFDTPILNNYYPGDLNRFAQLDMLEQIHKALGFRLKLDDVAAATVGVRKSGHGLQAVEWWKQGEIQKIKDYCLQDVKVTKAVYEYGLKYGALAYEDRLGGRKAIPVDFSRKEAAPAINLSMGF